MPLPVAALTMEDYLSLLQTRDGPSVVGVICWAEYEYRDDVIRKHPSWATVVPISFSMLQHRRETLLRGQNLF